MLKVRFPNGQEIIYNKAHQLVRGSAGWCLYESDKQKEWIASIQLSAGCIVEAVEPCGVSNRLEYDKRLLEMELKEIKRMIKQLQPKKKVHK